MTSNIGSYLFRKMGSIGFNENVEPMEDYKDKIQKTLRDFFKPEFLNRIDEIIIFRPLSKEDLRKIVDIQLQKVKQRLFERGIEVEFSKDIKEILVEKGFDEVYGARPLQRAIQKYILNPLSEKIIAKKIHDGQKIILDIRKNGLEVAIKK
jgi:ATP-dependent Clp protease ATP-binding subunit ClpA